MTQHRFPPALETAAKTSTEVPPLWVHGSYRADIDGLRAWAVLSTVGFHAFPTVWPGGFTGVDIFFVISGFLITGLLLDAPGTGWSRLAAFYQRRIRRIFPAVTLVLACTLAVGWVSLYADEYRQLGKHTFAAGGFVANMVLWAEVGYFDNLAHTKPLLHFWSLAVEEQFYVFWPLLLALVLRWRRWTLLLTLGLCAVSLGGAWWIQVGDASAAFYGPLCRFWELGAGCALAIWQKSTPVPKVPTSSESEHPVPLSLCGWLGAGLLLWASLWPLAATPMTVTTNDSYGGIDHWVGMGHMLLSPGTWRVPFAVLGAVLLILQPTSSVHALLRQRWLVALGRVSFPWYLWHWPLLTLLRLQTEVEPSALDRIAALIVSLGLAVWTYRVIERPVRTSPASVRQTIGLLGAMVGVAMLGAGAWLTDGLPQRLPQVSVAQSRAADWDYPDRNMHEELVQGVVVLRVGGDGPQTLFVGDSAMEQFGPRISRLLGRSSGTGRGAVFLTHGGDLPIDGVRRIDGRVTDLAAMRRVLQDSRIDRVVIGAAWPLYFNADKQDLGLSGPIVPRYFVDDLPLDGDGLAPAKARLTDELTRLKVQGKRVYLVSSIPAGKEFGRLIPQQGRTFWLRDVAAANQTPVPRAVVDQRLKRSREMLQAVAQATGAQLIDPVSVLCNVSDCPWQPFKDVGHLRASFVRERFELLDTTVLP